MVTIRATDQQCMAYYGTSNKENPMIDTLSIYNHLRRPALLFKAAQIALKSYRRDIKLPQLLSDANALPTPLDALD